MKKIIYYFTCILSWLVIVFIFAAIRTLIVGGESSLGFLYDLGKAVVNIPLWIITLGIVLYSRPYLYLLVFEKKRAYNQTTAIIAFGLGLLLIILRGVVN